MNIATRGGEGKVFMLEGRGPCAAEGVMRARGCGTEVAMGGASQVRWVRAWDGRGEEDCEGVGWEERTVR